MVPLLQVRHEARVAKDKDFQYLVEDAANVQSQRKKLAVSLNEADRRKERDMREARIKAREKIAKANKNKNVGKNKKAVKEDPESTDSLEQDDGLLANERSLSVELAAEKARKKAKDVLLEEAASILGDEIELLNSNTKLAGHVPPSPH